jgi:hypothetical protein
LKRERDFNCAPWYYKTVNYKYDYNKNAEIKIYIYWVEDNCI